jgi:cytoskeletal protein CcmA (bactofilin family)
MFSWTRSQNPPSDSHEPLTKPHAPGPATAVAEPPVGPASPEPEGPAPTRRFTDAVAPCATRLGRLQIRGILTGSDSVELSGTFTGPINVEGLCRVNAGGHVTGDLTAGDAVIAGDIQGRLTVIGRLELGAHARVLSDIEAGTIAIAEGCFIEGRIHMRGSDVGSQPVSFKEKRRGRRRKHHGQKANPPAAPSVANDPVDPLRTATTEPSEGSSEA